MKLITLVVFSIWLSGCALFGSQEYGRTQAEQKAGYSYVPVEPSSVEMLCKGEDGNYVYCKSISKNALLASLPDNSIRIATRNISAKSSSGLSAIGANIGAEGNTYEVIIEFVNTQTTNKKFLGKWRVNVPDYIEPRGKRCYPFERPVMASSQIDNHEIWTLILYPWKDKQNYQEAKSNFDTYLENRGESDHVELNCGKMSEYYKQGSKTTAQISEIKTAPEEFNVPVYIGIGLRLKANVTILKGEVNLSSLPALALAVESKAATGTMSVQTIGITGKAARTNLLLLDKIDTTTIQNAIQVLASIKASIESGDTTITPRIVGFHNTVAAGPQGVNLIHSYISGAIYPSQLIIDDALYATGGIKDDSETN